MRAARGTLPTTMPRGHRQPGSVPRNIASEGPRPCTGGDANHRGARARRADRRVRARSGRRPFPGRREPAGPTVESARGLVDANHRAARICGADAARPQVVTRRRQAADSRVRVGSAAAIRAAGESAQPPVESDRPQTCKSPAATSRPGSDWCFASRLRRRKCRRSVRDRRRCRTQ